MIQRYFVSHAARGGLLPNPAGALVTHVDHLEVCMTLVKLLDQALGAIPKGDPVARAIRKALAK